MPPPKAPEPRGARRPSRQLPELTSNRGAHALRAASSRISAGGKEFTGRLSRQAPRLSAAGQGIHGTAIGGSFEEYFTQLAARLRRVRVCCGDWSRVVSDSATVHVGETGVFLDPPYLEGNVDYAAGGVGTSLSADVRAWAIEHGDHPKMKIALAGYEGEHAMPKGWQLVEWKAKGGYGNTRKGGEANENARRERIWFSPRCELAKRQASLFDAPLAAPSSPAACIRGDGEG